MSALSILLPLVAFALFMILWVSHRRGGPKKAYSGANGGSSSDGEAVGGNTFPPGTALFVLVMVLAILYYIAN